MAQKRGEKSLRDEENEAVRALVRRLIDQRFRGNMTRAAEAWGVRQPTISDLLLKKRGAGMKLVTALASYAHLTLDQVLGRASMPTLATTTTELVDRYDNRARAVRAARELGYPEEAIEVVQSIAWDSDVDPEPDEWLEWIKTEARKLKFARKDPQAAEREQAVNTVNVAAISEESRLRKAEAKRQLEERDRAEAEERKRAGGEG